MTYDEDEDQDDGGNGAADYSEPELDPFATAIALCQVVQRAKTIEGALKRLRKIGRDILAAERKRDAVTAETEQIKTALAEREAAIAAREVALEEREAVFTRSCTDVRGELRAYHNHLDETHRQLIHRIMATAGILSGWNPQLQDLPTWQQLRRQIADLPADPAPVAEAASREVTTDWTGQHNFIAGSSLTRSVPQ